MASLMADRPHFGFPFQRGSNGKIAVVEQDTIEHINACCQVIARCPVGHRLERPEFGWQFPEFKNAPVDPAPLVDAIRRFEPRASSVTAREFADMVNDAVRHISVDVEASG
jgi:phage baseplate assembly protein W